MDEVPLDIGHRFINLASLQEGRSALASNQLRPGDRVRCVGSWDAPGGGPLLAPLARGC